MTCACGHDAAAHVAPHGPCLLCDPPDDAHAYTHEETSP